MLSFEPFPAIETENLILRSITEDDTYDLFQMRSDLRMHAYTDSMPDETIKDTDTYIKKMLLGIKRNEWIIWAIEHKESRNVIGTVSIWNFNEQHSTGELGFGIAPAYQGKGLMKEALQSIISYGFREMHLKMLEAYTEAKNTPSRKLLERLGFQAKDELDEKGVQTGKAYHMIVYRLENSDCANE